MGVLIRVSSPPKGPPRPLERADHHSYGFRKNSAVCCAHGREIGTEQTWSEENERRLKIVAQDK